MSLDEKHDFLEETIAFWQPLSPRPLSREDARQMTANVSGFFAVLAEWDAQDQQESARGKKAAS